MAPAGGGTDLAGGWTYKIIDKTTLHFYHPTDDRRSSANAGHFLNRTSTGGSTPNPPSASKHPAEHDNHGLRVAGARANANDNIVGQIKRVPEYRTVNDDPS